MENKCVNVQLPKRFGMCDSARIVDERELLQLYRKVDELPHKPTLIH